MPRPPTASRMAMRSATTPKPTRPGHGCRPRTSTSRRSAAGPAASPAELPPDVRDSVPAGLGREADRFAAALGLDVDERVRLLVEGDVQLAFLDPLVQPGASEDQPAQPVHERALGGPHQLGPALVDVLAKGGRRIADLAVDDEVDQVLGLVVLDRSIEEPHLPRGLLAAFAEIALVEREPQLAVLEHK